MSAHNKALLAVAAIFSAALLFAVWLSGALSLSAAAFKHETRVRYPGEEAVAKEACAGRKVMYWWVENPRRSRATMHIECAGKVSVEREVKF